MSNISLALVPKNDFKAVAAPPAPTKENATPFSIRFTPSEKAYLTQKAGCRPLGAYIREELLGKQADLRRKERKPKADEKQVAALLAGLGQSRIPSNLNQLAKAANQGTLGTSEEIEQQLQDACAAVLAMREALFTALGLRSGSET
jgi:hypothetical protein